MEEHSRREVQLFEMILSNHISGEATLLQLGAPPLVYIHGIVLFLAWYFSSPNFYLGHCLRISVLSLLDVLEPTSITY
jgi:hypothetical protein